MSRYAVLLRGVNVGGRNRVPMARLREVLDDAGFDEVTTYLQSGNVILESPAKADAVARRCEHAIADAFGFEIDVVVRTRADLERVVARNPLGRTATSPKRYLVSFLAERAPAGTKQKLDALCADAERVVVSGGEIYAWLPEGVGRSKLWAALAARDLGVTATTRNWTTVTKLLELVA